jgi:hypothetical protein
MVLRQGMLLAVAGVIIGVAGAFGMNRVIAWLLFGIEPTDPLTITFVVGAIGTVAFLAATFRRGEPRASIRWSCCATPNVPPQRRP